ncbi:MAG: cytidylate kinase family protein [Betaproteobacteria bacterium]|nr:cytidylate kinase family protein [Betaproteobacteria bacterium]
MTVIAFTQEMATLGSDVAAGVCEALGLAMVRHEVGDHVAGKMHVKKSLIRRLREGKAGPFERWTADERSISLFTAEEVYDLAVKGGVLVRGWGATMILRTVAHVPCIRVCAPMDLRVERLMRRLETDDEKLARHEIAVDDHARASRMSEHFGVHWGDPELFDLTLNTARIPVATCVDMVVGLSKSASFQETPESRAHLANLALRSRVRSALKANPATAGIGVSIDVQEGRLILRGIVADEREHALCHRVVEEVAGGAGVEDELTTMSGRMKTFPQQPRK